jgi:hypothetical protein
MRKCTTKQVHAHGGGDMDYDMPHLIDIYIAVRLAGHHYMIDLIKEVV